MTLPVSVQLLVSLKLVLGLECLSTSLPVTLEVCAVDPGYVPSQAGQAEQLGRIADVAGVALGPVFGLFPLGLGLLRGLRVVAVMCPDMVCQVFLVGEGPLAVFAVKRLPVKVPLLVSLSQLDSVEHDATVGATEGFPLFRVQVGPFVFLQLLDVVERSSAYVAF